MSLSHDEAATALNDISRTEERSARAYGYQMAWPHLILWGFIWAAGYGGDFLMPRQPLIFPALSLVGVIGSYAIGVRMKGKTSARFSWRYAATFVAVIAFISALFDIIPPTRGTQIAAFFPLVVALAYMLLGIWGNMLRIAVVGLAIGALTVYGYFEVHAYYSLWLAAVGGGALIIGGLWLRRI